MANAGPVLFDPVREALKDYAALDFIRDLRVLPPYSAAEAGLVGAAACSADPAEQTQRHLRSGPGPVT